MERNTTVIFPSDNGGYIGIAKSYTVPMTSNALLRSGRGELYEGGIRVSRTDPLFVFGFHKGGTYRAQISG